MNATEIKRLVVSATKPWAKRKAAEERDARAAWRRREERQRERRRAELSLKDAVCLVMPEAANRASGGGVAVFNKRNLYYAVRKLIQEHTQKELRYNNFGKILKSWEAERGLIDGLYRDPRGHLVEPHTGNIIPLGTREVDDYTIRPWLYDKLLMVEKKGFGPMLAGFKLAERYDLAIVAAEGYASYAAKSLMSRAEKNAITVVCLHDADPHGKHLCENLRKATMHSDGINVIDIGLTLEEGLELGLETEDFARTRELPADLELTDLEREMWIGKPDGFTKDNKPRYRCQRIELNALAVDPDRFVEFIERKLSEHGLDRKLVPPDAVIADQAERHVDDVLDRMVRHEVASRLNVEKIVGAVLKQVTVDVRHVPDEIRGWATAMEPKSWSAVVDDVVRLTVTAHAADVRNAVNLAVDKSDGWEGGEKRGGSGAPD